MNRRKNSLDNTTAVTATTASSTLEELESLSLRAKDATAATPAAANSSRRRSSSSQRPSVRRLSSQELRDKMTPPNSQEFRVLKKSRNTTADQDEAAADAMSFSEEGEDLFAAEHVPRTPRSKSKPKVSLQQQQQPNWDPFASTPQSLDSGSGHRAKQLLEDVHRVLKQSLRLGSGGSDPNNHNNSSSNNKKSSSSKKSKKSSSNNTNSMDKHLRKEKLQKRRNSIDTASISDDHTRASSKNNTSSSVRGGSGKTQRRRNSLFGGLTHLQQPQDNEPPALEPMTTPHAPSKPKVKRTSPSSPKTSTTTTTRTRSPPKRTSSSRQLHTQAAQPIFTTLARKHHGLLATSTGTGTSNSTANRRGSLDSATAASSSNNIHAMTPASQVLEKVRALRRSKSRNEADASALDSSNASSTKSSSPSETAALTQLDESQTSKLEASRVDEQQADVTMDDSVIRKSSKSSRRKNSSKDNSSSGSRRRSLSAQDDHTELGLSEHAAQLQRQLGKSKSSRRVLHRNKSMDSAVVEEENEQQGDATASQAAPSGNRALWLQQSKQPLAVGTSSRTLSTPSAAAAPGRSFRRSKSVRLVPETSATGATKKLTMEPVSLDRSLSCRKLRSNSTTTAAHVVPVEHHNSNSTALTMSTTSCSSASESNDSHADLVVGGGRFLRRRSSSMASSSHSQQHQQQQAQVQPQPQAPQPLMRRSSSVEFSLSASQHAAQEQQEQQQQSRRASLQSSSTSTPEAPTQMPRRVSMARARSSRRLVTRKDAKGVRQKMENGWDDFVSARNVVVS